MGNRFLTGERKTDKFDYDGFNVSRFQRDALLVFAYCAGVFTSPLWLQEVGFRWETPQEIAPLELALGVGAFVLLLSLAGNAAFLGYHDKIKK